MSDIIVIGGGISGVCVGARLSHLGAVTVLEAESALGYHASGRSAALFEETYGLPSTIALNRASRAYHMTANGGVTSPRGLMLLAGEGQDAAFEKDLAQMELAELTLDQATALVPILSRDSVTRVGHREDAWDLDTDRLIQNFTREVRRNGGQVLCNQRVTAITRTGTGWRVETANGVFEAALLVNAAGAWVDQIATMAGIAPLGFTPYRRSMARIPAPGGHDLRGWPMMFGVGESWYAKPDAGSLLVSPAEEDPMEPFDAWPEDMVLAEGLARYEAMVTEPVTRLETSWAGLRTFAPDRALVIGHDTTDPAFFWFAGQGGYGFQTAPATSALAADLVAGRAPEIGADVAAQLSPARFV